MIKCDEAMRRSKERCWTVTGSRWRCHHDCENCHCALFKKEDGTWEHTPVRLGHSHGEGEANV